jgi:hypothetical protein
MAVDSTAARSSAAPGRRGQAQLDWPMIRDVEHPRGLPSADAEYRFGKPKMYLSTHELARLTLLRSRLGGTRRERAAEELVRSSRRATAYSSAHQALHHMQCRSELRRSQ